MEQAAEGTIGGGTSQSFGLDDGKPPHEYSPFDRTELTMGKRKRSKPTTPPIVRDPAQLLRDLIFMHVYVDDGTSFDVQLTRVPGIGEEIDPLQEGDRLRAWPSLGVLSVAMAFVPVSSLIRESGQHTFDTALGAGWFVVFTVNGCMCLRESWKASADQP